MFESSLYGIQGKQLDPEANPDLPHLTTISTSLNIAALMFVGWSTAPVGNILLRSSHGLAPVTDNTNSYCLGKENTATQHYMNIWGHFCRCIHFSDVMWEKQLAK